jgi:hypothetical protein
MGATGLEPVTPSLSTRSYALRLLALPAVCSIDGAKERTVGSVFGSGLTSGQNGVCVRLRHCLGTAKAPVSAGTTDQARRDFPSIPPMQTVAFARARLYERQTPR